MKNKSNWKMGIFIAIIFLALISSSKLQDLETTESTPPVAEQQAEEIAPPTPAELHQQWVDSQFSAWDGSHVALVDLIKEYLNDPDSFEHSKTSYAPDGDDLIICMEYRAKNGFGALIVQNVTARASYSDNSVTIISEND